MQTLQTEAFLLSGGPFLAPAANSLALGLRNAADGHFGFYLVARGSLTRLLGERTSPGLPQLGAPLELLSIGRMKLPFRCNVPSVRPAVRPPNEATTDMRSLHAHKWHSKKERQFAVCDMLFHGSARR